MAPPKQLRGNLAPRVFAPRFSRFRRPKSFANGGKAAPWSLWLVTGAKSLRVVGQNLFVAALFNTVGIILAVMCLISALFAAAAMLFSTFAVVSNSLRLNPIIPSSE